MKGENILSTEGKVLRGLNSVLGILPFCWFATFLIILFFGLASFGEIPEYGSHSDPYSLGLSAVSFAMMLLFMGAFISFFTWPVFSLMLVLYFKKKTILNRLSIFAYLVGVAGYLAFRFVFAPQFAWVVD